MSRVDKPAITYHEHDDGAEQTRAWDIIKRRLDNPVAIPDLATARSEITRLRSDLRLTLSWAESYRGALLSAEEELEACREENDDYSEFVS